MAYDNRLNTFGKKICQKNQPFKGFKKNRRLVYCISNVLLSTWVVKI